MALGSVLDERKIVMDQRAARADALIERGNWVGLQRALEASKVRAQCAWNFCRCNACLDTIFRCLGNTVRATHCCFTIIDAAR